MLRLRVLRVVAVVSVMLSQAAAQVTTATIYGSITDPSGASVIDATVSLTNQETGATLQTQSRETGQFTFNFLPIGNYAVVVKKEGFKELKQSGIRLSAGQDLQLSLALTLGSATESVTVEAAPPQINLVNAEQRETHGLQEVREVPLVRRDWSGLLQVGTGIARSSYLPGGQAGGVVMNGLPGSGLRLTVDGTESSENPEVSSIAMFGGFNVIRGVSLEAISELNVTKGIQSAEIAGTMSGNININTRSGTNEFHGSLFENFQSNRLNARNQFLLTKPPVVFNQFGGSLGGPIVRNRLFFFGVYEGYRQRRFATINSTVATSEWRNQAIAAVPAYKPFFDIQPLPNQPYAPGARAGVYIGAGSSQANDNHAVVRGDYYLSPTNLITLRYTRGRPNSVSPRASTANSQRFQGLNEGGVATFFHTGSRWSTETRFGHKRNEVERIDGLFELGLAGISQTNRGFGDGGEYLASKGSNTSVEEVVAYSSGRHSWKFGSLVEFVRQNRPNVESPQISYCTDEDFLANIPCSAQVTWGLRPYALHNWSTGFFVQDDMRLTPNLSINAGVRYDYYAVPNEKSGRLFSRSAPFGFGALRPGDSIYNADRNNFSPRAGFAWNIGGTSKTVLRGGAGMFHSRPPLMHIIETVRNSETEPFRVVWSRAEALRDNIRYPVTNEATLPLVTGRSFAWTGTAVDEGLRTPFSYQWQFGVQQQLGRDTVFESTYVGNRGVNLILNRNMNLIDRFTGLRPVAGFGQFRYQDGSDSSRYHAWQNSFRKRLSNGLVANVHYTWSRAMTYSDGDLVSLATQQDVFNLKLERGPAPHDINHRFVTDFVYELPLARISDSNSLASRALLRGWQVAGIYTAESGYPFSIGQGGAIPGQRVDYIGGPVYAASPRDTLVYLNRAAFQRVPVTAGAGQVRPGNLGRNALRAAGLSNLDLALSKALLFTERVRLQIRADMFNALNHTNFLGISGNIDAANFGRFTSTRGAREMQVSARLTF